MKTGTCPECNADVEVKDDVKKSDIIECDECGAELEVFLVEPLEFEIIKDIDLDDDDDDDDDEDEL